MSCQKLSMKEVGALTVNVNIVARIVENESVLCTIL